MGSPNASAVDAVRQYVELFLLTLLWPFLALSAIVVALSFVGKRPVRIKQGRALVGVAWCLGCTCLVNCLYIDTPYRILGAAILTFGGVAFGRFCDWLVQSGRP